MKATLILLFVIFTLHAYGQQSAPPVKGTFHVYIDDSIHLFLNGSEILARENTWTVLQTKEVELKPGDRIVARLRNGGGPRGFMILFASTDLRQMVSFTNNAFKILANPNSTDCSLAELASGRTAKQERSKSAQPFPFKSRSEWIWGDKDACTIASIITPEMFQPLRK